MNESPELDEVLARLALSEQDQHLRLLRIARSRRGILAWLAIVVGALVYIGVLSEMTAEWSSGILWLAMPLFLYGMAECLRMDARVNALVDLLEDQRLLTVMRTQAQRSDGGR